MYAEYFNSPDDLQEHVELWNKLARDAVNPNPFFEPWNLLAAMRHLKVDGVHVLVIWESHSRTEMLGLIPLYVERRFRGLPLKRTTVWRHEYCFLSTPLIVCHKVREVLCCMLSSINNSKVLPSFVSMYWQAGNSEIVSEVSRGALSDFEAKGQQLTASRAMVSTLGDYDSIFLPKLNKKKAKELRRNQNRLSEQGELQVSRIDCNSSDATVERAIQTFFVLENQGWKHDQGTAIACNNKHQAYFEECLLLGIKNGGVHFVTMSMGEETIASVILVQSVIRTHAYTIKIASDQQYQQYSLGSLLMLEATQFAFEDLEISTIDSCAAPNHPMINRIWRERTELVNINVTRTNDFRGALITITDCCRGFAKKLQGVKA